MSKPFRWCWTKWGCSVADTQRTAQELADELEQYCDESDGSQYGTLSTKLVRGFVADLRAILASQAEPVAPTNDDAVGHIDEDGDVYIYDGAPRSVLLFAPPAPAQAEQSEGQFDDCANSPTGKHSESWFANGDCEHCNTGAQPNAPLLLVQAEPSEDGRDAARYRWLRERWGRVTETYDGDSGRITAIGTEPAGEGWDIEPETLDAAIDAALRKRLGERDIKD
jgi:hypothetical protein